jgi:hypothetical protein
MATAAELTTRLADLKRARDSGVLIVKHGDTSNTYRSLDEIERIIGEIESEISTLNGTAKRRVRHAYQISKGY